MEDSFSKNKIYRESRNCGLVVLEGGAALCFSFSVLVSSQKQKKLYQKT